MFSNRSRYSKVISILLIVALTFSFAACEANNSNESATDSSSASSNGGLIQSVFQIKLDDKILTATHLNVFPAKDEIILYTREFSIDGEPSLRLCTDHMNRTVIFVTGEIKNGAVLYEIASVKQNAPKDIPIPCNGFAVSVPTHLLENIRLRNGQAITVIGDEILPHPERTDIGTFRPNIDYSDFLTRRMNYIDPVSPIVSDGIYYLSARYTETAVNLPKNSIVVTLDGKTVSSLSVSSVSAISQEQLIFVGEYNCAYAQTFLETGMTIRFSDLDLVSSYYDSEALVIDDTTYPIFSAHWNTSHISESGVYAFDLNHTTVSTPESDLERIDTVIIDDTVAYIGSLNNRIMLPLSGGVAVSFVGEYTKVADSLRIGQKVQSVHFETALLPRNHVRINGIAFDIQKFDTVRAPEGVSLLYTPAFGRNTQTNPYGVEIGIQDGKVVSLEKGKGSMTIPENGYVLSIHQDHALYREANRIKVGDDAVLSLDASNYTVETLQVSGINTTRRTDTLIVYRGKPSTGTNEYGYEIIVNKEGIMVGESYSGNAMIPAGGFVLSGHGIYKESLAKTYCYGATVSFDENDMKVLLISTPETVLLDAAFRLESLQNKLQNAKETLLNLDYSSLDSSCTELKDCITSAKNAFSEFDFETVVAKLDAAESQWDIFQYALIEAHPVENRAIWYRSAEKSDAEVRSVVEKIKQLNINTLYLETWYNGRFVGFSDNELIEHSVPNGNYDAMEGFVRICHENGIEVHAWVQNFFIGTVEAQEQGNMKLANYYSDWLKDRKGKNTFFYTASNTNFMFLNPFDPNVRKFLLNFYKEMIEKYDIDGLHLDYIRFPELNYGSDDFGYNENIISAWQKANNTTVDPATLTSGTLYQSWILFRQEIINSFVKEVYEMVMDTNPDIWLSAAVYPGIPSIKNDIFQDCANWVENGYMDELFSMSYGADNAYVSGNASAFAKLSGDTCFYSTGISAFGETVPMNFALQMTEVTQAGADGVAIFSLANIEPSNYLKPITEGAFRIPSVQTNKLNLTVSAQLKYVLEKAEMIYIPYADLSEEEYAQFETVLKTILDKANGFDSINATHKEKRTYCSETIKSLENALTQIAPLFTEEQFKSVRTDFDNLIHWLTKSENRLNARID